MSDPLESFETLVCQLMAHQNGRAIRVRPTHLPDSVAAMVCPCERETVVLVDMDKPGADGQALFLMEQFYEASAQHLIG